jgi:hypothetical protein
MALSGLYAQLSGRRQFYRAIQPEFPLFVPKKRE